MNRITTQDISDEHFFCQEKDSLTLYLPSHTNAVGNGGWTQENIWFRSRIEDQDKRTVSQSWPKFFNLGQGPDGLRVDVDNVLDAIKNNKQIVATLKYDGSCLIRYVHNGEVKFRTRGSFDYRFHDKADAEFDVFRDRYPMLFDPNFVPDTSLIFEWLSPDAQIVIKYDEPDLVLIGGFEHGNRHIDTLKMMTMGDLTLIAQFAGFRMVEFFEINSIKGWHEFYHDVIQSREIEGYVLRLGENEDQLVKVKANPYIAKHALKSDLSLKRLVQFWLDNCYYTGDTIIEQLGKMYDEEIVMFALPFVIELDEGIKQWEQNLMMLRDYAREHQHWPRKDYAIDSQRQFAHDRILFNISMTLYQDPTRDIDANTIKRFMERFNV